MLLLFPYLPIAEIANAAAAIILIVPILSLKMLL
jgi:hypothetical protein